MALSRRSFLMGSPLVLAGCATQRQAKIAALTPQADPSYLAMYSSIDTEPFPVPAVDLKRVKPQFLRREVAYQTSRSQARSLSIRSRDMRIL